MDLQYKTYALDSSLDTTAPIFQKVNGKQRIRLNKIPTWQPYLRVNFVTKEGKSKTIRYKGNTDDIDQSEQIKNGILANEPFTTQERDDVKFRNGVLITKKPTVAKYLDEYPGNSNFEGICDQVIGNQFHLVDKIAEIKSNNQGVKERATAALKILGLDLQGAKDLLIKLNGGFYQTSDDLDENIGQLVDFLDATDELGIKAILEEDLNIDQETEVLIGNLINAKLLDFDSEDGKIKKKKGNDMIVVREFAGEYSMDERKRMFADFISSPEGVDLRKDLEKDLKAFQKKNQKEVVNS